MKDSWTKSILFKLSEFFKKQLVIALQVSSKKSSHTKCELYRD